MTPALRVSWYRFHGTFGRRWGGYLAIAIVIGLLGGLAIGAVAAGRRTQASFDEFAQDSNASDLVSGISIYNPAIGVTSGYSAQLIREIARLPHVTDVGSEVGLTLLPLGPKGWPLSGSAPVTYGSVNRLGFEQDRIVIAHGRLPNPKDTDDFVMDAATAKEWGYHLGERVTFGLYSDPQSLTNAYFNNQLRPRSTLTATLVGIGTADAFNVVQDQSDAANSALVLFTPALTRRLLDCCAADTSVGVQIEGGSQSVRAVEVDLEHLLAKHGQPGGGIALSVVSARAQRAVKPESTALEVFGGIAALATLIIAGQLMARRLRFDGDDLAAMRALGADPAMIVLDGLLGMLGAVLAGTALAGVAAVALSPLAPLGPLRQYLPIGLHVDWIVVGSGLAVILIGLSSAAWLFAYRGTPHREALRPGRIGDRRQHTSRAAAAAGLPVSAVIGIRFALEPGSGRNAVPVRSAILGSVLAVVLLTATLTFGASLNVLVTHPALYGWNWNYELSGNGGDVPSQVEPLLDKDRLITSWSGAYFGNLIIDGQHVPVLGDAPGARVAPPLLSGHGLETSDQVVLGAVTLDELHNVVGDTVEVSASGQDPVRLRIVGTATMPATGGGSGGPHLEMGTGAILSYRLIPSGARNPFDQPQAGPNTIFIRDKPGTSRAAIDKSISSIITKLGGQSGPAPLLGPQRPAEIINYRNLGTTPAALGAALAAGAVVALGLTMVASVRRRRRDLALLKTLGFTKFQLTTTLAWQSTVAVAFGVAGGIPLGIALGRYLWDLFVDTIHAVPVPTVPALSIVLVGLGALVLANLVAAVPARIAARTTTALLLRAE